MASHLYLPNPALMGQPPVQEPDKYLKAVKRHQDIIDKLENFAFSYLKRAGRDDTWYQVTLQDMAKTQEKRFDGDVLISRDRDAVLAEIDKIIVSAGDEENKMMCKLTKFVDRLSRKSPVQDEMQWNWSMEVVKHYKAEHSPGLVWCPITKSLGSYDSRVAVLLAPRKLTYQTMDHLFDGDGATLMWSTGNGFIMEYNFAETFENLDFCLIPHKRRDASDGLQLVLINEDIRHELAYEEKTWNDYDKTLLEWSPGCEARPERRFFFFQFWMCLLKSQRYFKPGWRELIYKASFQLQSLWVTPGIYISARMIRAASRFAGPELAKMHKQLEEYCFDCKIKDADFEAPKRPEIITSVKDIFECQDSARRLEV